MEIKKTLSKVTYRIEERPGGGFIARPSDPSGEALEAATREELLQKVQAKAAAQAQDLPQLLAAGGMEGKLIDWAMGKGALKVNTKISVTSKRLEAGAAGSPAPAEPAILPPSDPMGASTASGNRDRTGTLLRVLAALVALAAIIYFLVHR